MTRFSDALDNYITGHYGEDQYPDEPEHDPAENIPEIVSVCEELNCDCCMDLECPHNKYQGSMYIDGKPGFSDYPLECAKPDCPDPYKCKGSECEHWRGSDPCCVPCDECYGQGCEHSR